MRAPCTTPWRLRAPLSGNRLIWITLALVLTLQPITLLAERPDDEAIAIGVRQALASHPALGDERITVVVRNGIVELSGYVDSRYERAVADTVAERVDGVRAIDNLLEPTEKPSRLIIEPASDRETDSADSAHPVTPARPTTHDAGVDSSPPEGKGIR